MKVCLQLYEFGASASTTGISELAALAKTVRENLQPELRIWKHLFDASFGVSLFSRAGAVDWLKVEHFQFWAKLPSYTEPFKCRIPFSECLQYDLSV